MTGPCVVPCAECENRILGGGGGAEVTSAGAGADVVVGAWLAAAFSPGDARGPAATRLRSRVLRGWAAPSAARSPSVTIDIATPSATTARRWFTRTSEDRRAAASWWSSWTAAAVGGCCPMTGRAWAWGTGDTEAQEGRRRGAGPP